MSSAPRRRLALLLVALGSGGCASIPARNPLPVELRPLAEIPGIPGARRWGDAAPPNVEDWFDHDADWIVDRLASQIQPGSVIVLHDRLFDAYEERYFDREPVLKAVNLLLDTIGLLIALLSSAQSG